MRISALEKGVLLVRTKIVFVRVAVDDPPIQGGDVADTQYKLTRRI